MTVVFVHGVPETTAVWRPLVGALDLSDAALVALPGFGCPLPDGFEPTMERYARWLAETLEGFDQVDLVTHDWGSILALRVLADRPATIRSWVSDMGDLDPTFEWHDTAKLWQTPGEGEAFMEAMVGATIAERAALLGAVGVPEPGATEMAQAVDATMAHAILGLYRSATRVGHEWGPGIDQITAPGLLVASMQDPFRSAHRVSRLAERTGAQVLELPDAGHFWMLEVPERAAHEIRAFWAGI